MKKLYPLIIAVTAIAFFAGCKSPPPPVEAPPPDTEGPVVNVGVSSGLFSPDGDGENDEWSITLSAEDEAGILSWSIEIYEPSADQRSGALFYQAGGSGAPPAVFTWDGRSNTPPQRDGEPVQSGAEYGYSISVTDNEGNVTTKTGKIVVADMLGPDLDVHFSPALFSPDGDGENDELFVTLSAKDPSGIRSWKIKVYEPNSEDHLFFEAEGEGEPDAEYVWDGRSNITDELVQSASDYSWVFSAVDNVGNESIRQSSLESGDLSPLKVDILVIRDGDTLRAQVPSIVFGPNSGGFTGVNSDVVENNEYIIERIAEVLKKFDTYKVTVEGHTNPLAQTERERQRELVEDRKLSIQRAQTVIDQLVNFGVARSRLTAVGVGGARPLAPYADADGKPNRDNWWKNRRVEFILIK